MSHKETPTPNHAKLTSFIHYSLAEVFAKLGLNIFKGSLVTLTEVQLTVDKHVCKIYVSIMDDSLSVALMDELESQKSEIKKQLSYKLRNKMRFVPSEYSFYPDKTAAKASKLVQLIDQLSASSSSDTQE